MEVRETSVKSPVVEVNKSEIIVATDSKTNESGSHSVSQSTEVSVLLKSDSSCESTDVEENFPSTSVTSTVSSKSWAEMAEEGDDIDQLPEVHFDDSPVKPVITDLPEDKLKQKQRLREERKANRQKQDEQVATDVEECFD